MYILYSSKANIKNIKEKHKKIKEEMKDKRKKGPPRRIAYDRRGIK